MPRIFDGELTAAFSVRQPDFLALPDRMLLTHDHSIPIAFVVFDVLSREGETWRGSRASGHELVGVERKD